MAKLPFGPADTLEVIDYIGRVNSAVRDKDITGSEYRAITAPLSGIVMTRPQTFNDNPARMGTNTARRFPFAEDRLMAATEPGGVPASNPAILSRADIGTAAGKEIRFAPQMIPEDRVGRFNPRARAGRNATLTGLVYARPDNIDQSFLRSSGALGKSDQVLEQTARQVHEAVGFNYKRAPLRTARNALTNLRTDRALAEAAEKGLRDEAALDFVLERVPAARDRVNLRLTPEQATNPIKLASDDPISKGSVTKGSRAPGIMSRKSSGGGFKVPSRIGKTARIVVKSAPVIGSVLDAKELFDELTEDEVEISEVVGATLDLAIGLTGVGGIVGDIIGIGSGSDGLGSAIVDNIGSFTGWWDRDED